jgi:GNAT superfamily N-acetyltransferase
LEHGGEVAWLEELYVVPERREAGIGTKLLSRAIEAARERGCLPIDLEVDDGHSRATNLYR